MPTPATLRPPTDADAADCARILFDAFGCIARAHHFPVDFPAPEMAAGIVDMVLHHPKFFGVVAEVDGRVVGSNFLDQRDAIAAVGPITVDPGHQAHGVGRQLMQAVVDRARSAGHPGVRLVQDAFNAASISLYTSVGFDVKEPLALMQGRPVDPAPIDGQVDPLTAADVPACADLCRRVHGFDRQNELADAADRHQPVLLRRAGRVVAYASAPHVWFLNHGVAETDADLIALLAGTAAARDQPLALLVPTRRAAWFRWCLSHGLRVVKPLTLMAMGEYHDPRGGFYPSVAY